MTMMLAIRAADGTSAGLHQAAYVAADALRSAGAEVDVALTVPRADLAAGSLRGAQFRLNVEAPQSAFSALSSPRMGFPLPVRIGGAVLLALVLGSAEIRLAFPPMLDLVLIGAALWWFWHKTAAQA